MAEFNRKEHQMNDAPVETGKPWNWQLFPFSSVKAGEDAIYVASVGYGVYQINSEEQWMKLGAGMPQTAMVNRLQLQSNVLHACTSEGLYQYTNGEWANDGLAIPCYQYRMLGGTGYAATDYGLWLNSGSRWEKSACADKRVYDFMNLPQYLVVGHESGVALYDRFMDEWAEFELGRAVTSLAVYRGHLIGVSDRGELMIGDKKGRFDRIRFSKQFIFSIVAKGKDIYVCTDKGLFQLAYIRNQVTLLSVKLGIPVTDVDLQGDNLYMATLFQGIQMMDA
ncbi:hypothetical protein SAMN04487969_12159 [Paenibacillus algorifonticola]|uniref:Uncharacterized protein n=1 Tax=Paenibacillus algorifonticola TaxID=684063 RepID=A0A1I2H8W5_9BACL|nr:hypothetical protein [Paenibacillus algorifonticola]SFF26644.1 hypothetical protein SAMN04487969_12159 [Paenibacillus algorifonticola]